MFVIFRFYDCNGIIFAYVKNVISFFRSLTRNKISTQIDFTVGKFNRSLHCDFVLPATIHKRGRNVIEFDILLCHFIFLNTGHCTFLHVCIL